MSKGKSEEYEIHFAFPFIVATAFDNTARSWVASSIRSTNRSGGKMLALASRRSQ
jgi:hypothetical protein